MKNSIFEEMEKLNLYYTRIAGGRIFFAHIPNGTECIYFKSWNDVRDYIEWRKEQEVCICNS